MEFIHPIHGLLLIETFAFLFYVERRAESSPWALGLAHLVAATAIIVAAFVRTAVAPAGFAEPVSVGIAASLVAIAAFVVFALLPLIAAFFMRRRRSHQVGA